MSTQKEAMRLADKLHERRMMTLQRKDALIAELAGALASCVEFFNRVQFDASEGYCCCGESMEHHPSAMLCGHSAVDAGEYAASCVLQQAIATLAKVKQ